MTTVTDWPDLPSNRNYDEWAALECSRNLRPRFQAAIAEMQEHVRRLRLIQPRLAYETTGLAGIEGDVVHLQGGEKLIEAPIVAEKFGKARELVMAVATLGPGIETEVAEFFRQKKAVFALALEEIAVAAIFELNNLIAAHIAEQAGSRGLKASSPLYPGNDGFDFSQQRSIYGLAGGARIGMDISGGGMLSPVKSASMLFAIGETAPVWDRRADCSTCKAREVCRFRNRGDASIAA
ncbi:MAG: hypothetical protein QGH73_13275 [Rhodospirillales bacterium]|jgi:hypothetical protein|nr:hypothetical protein [Rhodospirillaceae bacterium]MDP6427197.1 hypothetical protein [Rhodospirillales bacterium]MDP6646591.1 hypothetical protein [Rhodospirillales bacterium]MDP6842642.1 hypothetical protein [Rhodospirillales bacterium]